jgi:hypothetical protein
LLVVNVGSTRLSTARVVTVAKAAPVPSALKTVTRRCSAPTSRDRPRMPLHVIMIAAKTVSLASVSVL